MKMAIDQKCRLWRGVGGGGVGAWPAGMRDGATAGPVGDLRKRFSSPWLSSVDNRSSWQVDPFGVELARSIIRICGRGYGGDAGGHRDRSY